MILYFADRQLNILGHASTMLPDGLGVLEDRKTEDVETGVAVFECKIPFDDKTRAAVYACADVGNYILRSHDSENEFYTIIEAEIDTKNQEVYIYAEDAGLDLLNEVVGAYAADAAYPITHYIEQFAYDSGFEIGVNEAASLSRKLSWDGEATAAERIASVATQFDGCEVSYSFDIDGLEVTHKYINIHKQRGKDIGATLRLNEDIDCIVTKKSIANLATALQCTGGTPEDENAEDDVEPVPITLDGYEYDDGDFYVDGGVLKSREALKRWSRYSWTKEPNQTAAGGHIVRQFSYDTLSQKELCARALTELKKACQMEVNYEVDIAKLPDNVKIGDRINIVDDAGELYVSARVLQLETSVADQEYTATLGEYLIKGNGISQKVADLAAQFAAQAAAQTKAREEAAKKAAQAAADAEAARLAAEEAAAKAAQAEADLQEAQEKAEAAQAAATEAQAQADAAAAAAAQAKADAADANAAVEVAQTAAQTATTKAEAAQSTADAAKTEAADAKSTADAAQLDAEQAKEDVAALGAELETVSNTMQADYARKTDLTETEASLQTKISQNAAQIESTATKVTEIDETANNAAQQAQQAQNTADSAKAQADAAKADAATAQTAADNAAAAAASAQNNADAATAAAQAAQAAADDADAKAAQAEADLASAKENLANVTSRVDATEADVAAAQAAVETAQAAADKAKADAATAQSTADTAKANAATAQTAANNAKSAADAAQATADEAQQAADDAQAAADALDIRVTTAETQIEQNSEAITLRATMEEVSEISGRVDSADALLQMLVDSISTLVRDKNGTSLMQQTSTGWTFSMGNVQDTLDSTTAKLDGVSSDVDALNSQVAVVEQAVKDLGELGNYVRITTDGDQPCIELGEGDSAFKLKITNTGIEFMEGSAIPAWINNESLHIRKAVVEEELRQGEFVWKARENGNLGLLWEG